ncbi:hypothetical protein QOT17_006739 [Balamuthia mandrillaris]
MQVITPKKPAGKELEDFFLQWYLNFAVCTLKRGKKKAGVLQIDYRKRRLHYGRKGQVLHSFSYNLLSRITLAEEDESCFYLHIAEQAPMVLYTLFANQRPLIVAEIQQFITNAEYIAGAEKPLKLRDYSKMLKAGYAEKKGSVKWSQRFLLLTDMQLLCYKERWNNFPVNVIENFSISAALKSNNKDNKDGNSGGGGGGRERWAAMRIQTKHREFVFRFASASSATKAASVMLPRENTFSAAAQQQGAVEGLLGRSAGGLKMEAQGDGGGGGFYSGQASQRRDRWAMAILEAKRLCAIHRRSARLMVKGNVELTGIKHVSPDLLSLGKHQVNFKKLHELFATPRFLSIREHFDTHPEDLHNSKDSPSSTRQPRRKPTNLNLPLVRSVETSSHRRRSPSSQQQSPASESTGEAASSPRAAPDSPRTSSWSYRPSSSDVATTMKPLESFIRTKSLENTSGMLLQRNTIEEERAAGEGEEEEQVEEKNERRDGQRTLDGNVERFQSEPITFASEEDRSEAEEEDFAITYQSPPKRNGSRAIAFSTSNASKRQDKALHSWSRRGSTVELTDLLLSKSWKDSSSSLTSSGGMPSLTSSAGHLSRSEMENNSATVRQSRLKNRRSVGDVPLSLTLRNKITKVTAYNTLVTGEWFYKTKRTGSQGKRFVVVSEDLEYIYVCKKEKEGISLIGEDRTDSSKYKKSSEKKGTSNEEERKKKHDKEKTKKKKSRKVIPVARVVDVVSGHKTTNFLKHRESSTVDLAFSICFVKPKKGDRSLDLELDPFMGTKRRDLWVTALREMLEQRKGLRESQELEEEELFGRTGTANTSSRRNNLAFVRSGGGKHELLSSSCSPRIEKKGMD